MTWEQRVGQVRLHGFTDRQAAFLVTVMPHAGVDVLNLLAPPTSLMTPRVLWRVLARSAPGGPGSPRGSQSPGSGSGLGTEATAHTAV